MNRFKEAMDDLRQRPAAKQTGQLLPQLPNVNIKRDEIEVTAPMIEAGVLELVTFGDWSQAREIAERVFRAMVEARQSTDKAA